MSPIDPRQRHPSSSWVPPDEALPDGPAEGRVGCVEHPVHFRRHPSGYVPVTRFRENVVAAEEAHSAVADRLRRADAGKLTLLIRRRLGGAVDAVGDDVRRRGQPVGGTPAI